eukprot:13685826-Alexandrium_andersonii.AAC.1
MATSAGSLCTAVAVCAHPGCSGACQNEERNPSLQCFASGLGGCTIETRRVLAIPGACQVANCE